MNKCKFYILLLIAPVLWSYPVEVNSYPHYVNFIAELPTPAEYNLFANGGWTGNWYVGKDHGWIKKLPEINTAGYERFFIGARLGRAKTSSQVKEVLENVPDDQKITEINPGPYTIHIGISDIRKQWPEGHILTTTDRIPREGSPDQAEEYVRESRWFWVEVTKDDFTAQGPNYIHLWSNNDELNGIRTAPILAGGVGSNEGENSFLVKASGPTVIKFFEPALAVKMVKENISPVSVKITDFKSHPIVKSRMLVNTEVSGDYVKEINLEINDGTGWEKIGYPVTSPPYNLVLDYRDLPAGEYNIRCRIRGWGENLGFSGEQSFTVTR